MTNVKLRKIPSSPDITVYSVELNGMVIGSVIKYESYLWSVKSGYNVADSSTRKVAVQRLLKAYRK